MNITQELTGILDTGIIGEPTNTQWVDAPLMLNLGPLQPLLETIQASAEAAKLVLEPISMTLELLSSIISAIPTSAIDLGELLPFNGHLLATHLYPAQPYQALRFATWARTAEKSCKASVPCSNPPYYLTVLLFSAKSVTALFDLIAAVQALFGVASTSVSDLPDGLNRDFYHIRPATCTYLREAVPVIGEILDYITTNIVIELDPSILLLKRAVLSKIQLLESQIQEVTNLLNLLTSFKLPAVKYLGADIASLGGIASTMTGSVGAPSSDTYVAGTVILSDPLMGVTIRTILGLEDTVRDWRATSV